MLLFNLYEVLIKTLRNEKNIGEMYQDLWLENVDLFKVEKHLELIIDECLVSLRRPAWLNKRQGIESIEKLVPVAGKKLLPFCNDIVGVLVELLPGRVWDGKESVPLALARVWSLAIESSGVSDSGAKWATANELGKFNISI